MDLHYRVADEPYYEGNIASPDEVKAFEEQAKVEVLERKLSKRSIFSRRQSSKRIAGPIPQPRRPTSVEMENVAQHQRDHQLQPSLDGRSIVPDILRDLPSWYHDSPSYYSTKFPLHNPTGPRFYLNHHLLPYRVNTRPPTIFSPAFPPLKTEDHTPSQSPQPTPTSSQTRVQDTAGKPRSRKNSQTAHDGVDLMDVTDPWGTNWHHGSPYDIGLSNGPVSPEVEQQQNNAQRSRQSSMTTKETRRRTMTPSPLSQSTSAVNLQLPETAAQLPRKLSKRRTPDIGTLFLPNGESPDPPKRVSRTPEAFSQTKRASTIPPVSAPPVSFRPPSEKSARRGSVLGRLVKKFSLMKKPGDAAPDFGDSKRISLASARQPSPVKRVPAPQAIAQELSSPSPIQQQPPPSRVKTLETDNASVSSVEQPFSIGKLTVANPDAPSEGDSTPIQPPVQLPETNSPPRVGSSLSPSPPTELAPSTAVTAPFVSNETSPLDPGGVGKDTQPTIMPLVPPTPVAPPAESVGGQDFLARDPPVDQTHPAAISEPQPPIPTRISHTHETLALFPTAERSSSVTFPASPVIPQYLTSLISSDGYDQSDSSPLSTASILANPPTPHVVAQPIISEELEPPALPPKRPSVDNKRPQREPSPGYSRQTETFQLVRSSSGTVYASSETIHVAGEQWEVMEAPHKARDGRKEFKRLDLDQESERRGKGSQRSHKHSSVESALLPPNKNKPLPPQANSAERQVHASHSSLDGSKSYKRDKSSDTTQQHGHLNLNKPQPPPPPPTPGPSVMRSLERTPSVSARPTSEVPSTADLNALRAKEAWEMERLWKARSMYGTEANGLTAPVPVNVPSTLAVNEPTSAKGAYGSSHTSFIVQTPFQPQGTHLYHPSVHVPKSTEPRQSSIERSFDPRPVLNNPLPEPPRESPYQPSPISNLLDSGNVHSSEYWTKYGGVTAAH